MVYPKIKLQKTKFPQEQGILSQTVESNLALREEMRDISDILRHLFSEKLAHFDI